MLQETNQRCVQVQVGEEFVGFLLCPLFEIMQLPNNPFNSQINFETTKPEGWEGGSQKRLQKVSHHMLSPHCLIPKRGLPRIESILKSVEVQLNIECVRDWLKCD